MAITVKHSKVSTIPDAGDSDLVRPSDWNADHTLVGTIDVSNGGTGAATLTGYVKGNGTSAMTASATVPNTDITGLGTMSTQNANNVNITGGTITGVTGLGDVTGPASSTDNAIARFDSTTGKLLQNSVVLVGDTGVVTGVTELTASTKVVSPHFDAQNSAGGALRNSSGTSQLQWGGGGGNNISVDVAININPANAQVAISPTGTGSVTINPATAGTINNMSIGATTASTGRFSDLTDTGLTATRVTYAGTGGNLVDSANLTFDGTTLSAAGLSDSGNLTFTGTGNRIRGDFGNATIANRTLFQTSITNSSSVVGVIPNGTAVISRLAVFNNSDPTNASQGDISVTSAEVQVRSLVTGTGTALPLTMYTAGSERLRIDTSGNVGIGTSSPSAKLHVAGITPNLFTGYSQLNIFSTDALAANVGGRISLGGVSGSGAPFDPYGFVAIAGLKENATSSNYAGYFTVSTSNSGGSVLERMRIDSSGNVGIGTSSPAANYTMTLGSLARLKMLPATNTLATYVDMESASGNFYMGIDSSTAGVFGQGNYSRVIYSTGAYPLVFTTNGSERMRITSSGNVLVGTTSVVVNSEEAIGAISLGSTGPAASFKNSAGANSNCVEVWNSATSGDNKFINFITETSYTPRGSITYNRAGGLVEYNVTSDYRAKDIISPVLNSGEVIDSVPVYMGKMKGATQARPMFIAHETPEYAHTGEKDAVDKDGKPIYQQMDASSLVPILWAEIQSLRKRVAQLESK